MSLNYFCFARMNSPTIVMTPPISVMNPMISLKSNQANNEAIMGSPIGVEATMVGETCLMEWYIKPWPNSVGIMPSNSK